MGVIQVVGHLLGVPRGVYASSHGMRWTSLHALLRPRSLMFCLPLLPPPPGSPTRPPQQTPTQRAGVHQLGTHLCLSPLTCSWAPGPSAPPGCSREAAGSGSRRASGACGAVPAAP